MTVTLTFVAVRPAPLCQHTQQLTLLAMTVTLTFVAVRPAPLCQHTTTDTACYDCYIDLCSSTTCSTVSTYNIPATATHRKLIYVDEQPHLNCATMVLSVHVASQQYISDCNKSTTTSRVTVIGCSHR